MGWVMRVAIAKAVAWVAWKILWGTPPPNHPRWRHRFTAFRGHIGCSMLAFALRVARMPRAFIVTDVNEETGTITFTPEWDLPDQPK